MPYLDQIVAKINTDLKANSLGDAKILSNLKGICTVMVVNDGEVSRFPSLVEDTGQGTFPLDDRYNLTVYHRCLSKSIVSDECNYGNGNDNKIMTCNMVAVCFAKKGQLQRSKDEIEDLIVGGLPTELDSTFKADYDGLNGVNIAATEINTDHLAVWNQEFNNYKYQLKTDQTLFAVNYTVEIKYKQSCLSVCSTC